MIRKQNTCRAYAIRPYSDGRKKLFLRSILGYVKQRDPFFNPKKGYAESIIYLFELRKGYERWHNPFFDLKNGHAKWQDRIFGTCFWEMFLRYLFQGVFFFVTKRKHSGFVVKSGVRNGESLFEKVYSSSSSCMDALSENKQQGKASVK